jgi:hypothetical protein
LDTNTLVNLQGAVDSHAVWSRVCQAMEEKRIKIAEHVWDEPDKWPDVKANIKAFRKYFQIRATDHYRQDVTDEVDRILSLHPELIDQTGEGNPADPWIVALAKVFNLVVVSDERRTGKKHTRKIPYVCRSCGIECIGSESFLEEIGVDATARKIPKPVSKLF